MTEEQAVAHGKQLLAEHGLTGWVIVVRPGVLARNGACDGVTVYCERTILLRTRDVLGHSDEEVRQLIAREVAHALNDRPGSRNRLGGRYARGRGHEQS